MIEGIFEFIILLVIGLCHDTFESTIILSYLFRFKNQDTFLN